ncbi:MAG: MBL fold metallo-hydrolase RNA specificity domain-containing protein, partial [Candidatus Bathyarchaeia archaeon]
SMSEPYSEEDIEDTVMHNWLDHFKIKFHQLHASGHLDRRQLTDLVRYIKPKKIFPIHTENPRLFRREIDNVRLPKYGKRFTM